MSPGPRVRQNASVQDDPVNHDESVKTRNGERTANWSRGGEFSTKINECTRTGVTMCRSVIYCKSPYIRCRKISRFFQF